MVYLSSIYLQRPRRVHRPGARGSAVSVAAVAADGHHTAPHICDLIAVGTRPPQRVKNYLLPIYT